MDAQEEKKKLSIQENSVFMRVNWGVKSVRMERKGQETLPGRWGRKRPWSCPGWRETMADPPESLELS